MNLKVKIGDVTFKNPIWVASGTFGYGKEFEDFLSLREVGAIVTKTVTLRKREGNKPPRIAETASGLVNSIGLENKGIKHFLKEDYPFLKETGAQIVVSIAGSNKQEILECAEKLTEKETPDAIELNLSCPNVAHGGTKHSLIAQDARATESIVKMVKRKVKCPVIAKLTPNVTDITLVAKAAEEGGIDAVSLVNTYPAMAVDAEEMKPLIGNITGGLSGPAIKPMALKAVRDAYKKISIPIIGIGGIMTGLDAAEFILCGARAVQVGTANFVDPTSHNKILSEFKDYLKRKKIKDIKSLTGKLKEK